MANKLNMQAFKIISRLLSLFVGFVNASAGVCWNKSLYKGWYAEEGGSKIEYYILLFIIEIVLAIPLIFIWFGDSLADLQWGDQVRSPCGYPDTSLYPSQISLLKFTSWVFLVVPAIIFIWYKIK